MGHPCGPVDRELEIERTRQETKRTLIRWSFFSGLVILAFAVIVIAGITA